ncbi:transcription termination factor MTEF18, mitochondrial-like isoform X2 [Mercurialis annua]|uniref:transcription termination factor MTEF18, mitochondrial-like isoform X2 n=1 Tax=Mercurialis annua TaxID=3986 RepID=UPI00215FE814|nr:transcription termination factor MTEF18, mitochondrial-like isoform X2 [Mercurialis annua]
MLLQKVHLDGGVGGSVTRFLRYHPINEFEPFFESLGFRPSQYRHFLPRNLMFLSDDELLLENFNVLCNYGIPRIKIGGIYKKAGEVFRYAHGVLATKLQAYEELGLDRSFMSKMIVCCPSLVIGDANIDFIKSIDILRKGGIECYRIEEHISEECSYNWSHVHALLNLLCKNGYSELLGGLLSQSPGVLFEDSGDRTLSLIVFLVKFGFSMNEICSMFLQFPQMQVGKFLLNMRQCYLFLTEIEMEILEIGNIIRSHPLMLGSLALKKTNSLLSILNVGKKRLCDTILENPQEMKNWAKGSKVRPLPKSGERLRSRMLKNKFLLDLGFLENSSEMEKALKGFRGRGTELQERFDCITLAGLNKKVVCEMVRTSPQILNQTKDVINMKISFLVNELGYPIVSLITFPAFLCYTIPTIKLRLAMYNWLKDQGKVDPMLSLSTVIGCSDKVFLKRYVQLHPGGPEFWQDLKKKFDSEQSHVV